MKRFALAVDGIQVLDVFYLSQIYKPDMRVLIRKNRLLRGIIVRII
jgi:hypothetical protein